MVAMTQHAEERLASQEIPVEEFDFDAPTVEIPAETMAALIRGEVQQ
jgi:hypothetical protein